MSLWQFAAGMDGFNRVHGGDGGAAEGMSAQRFRDLMPKG